MRRRPSLWRTLAVSTIIGALGTFAWWGCTSSYPETLYGDPTGLRSQNLPGEGGVIITGACEAGLPPDILAGGSSDGGAAEGGSSSTSNCKVSWSRHLYPRILPDGGWRCAASACHGGTQAPTMDASTPETLLGSLHQTSLAGLPYVTLPDASVDPTKASIYCNLSRTCGNAMPPSPALAPNEVCAIETWLRCGAPDN